MSKLRAIRFERNISQQELARMAGASQTHISILEREGVRPPETLQQHRSVTRIAEALGVEPEDLYDHDGRVA